MQVIVLDDADEVGRVAAAKIAHVLSTRTDPVLGLATGSSPLSVYADLGRRVAGGRLQTSSVTAFALDEYIGLPPGHEQSYRAVITREVTVPLRLDPSRVHVPDGTAPDIEAACRAYEQRLADCGPIDVQILGIGVNGHIGFNEPTSSFASRTRIKTLTPRTRADNARFFAAPEDVPTHCITQGLATILQARRLVLVATGAAKASAVAAMVEGPVCSMCPGTALQLHPHATVVVDAAAGARLSLGEYYRYTYANLPPSQRFEP